MIDLTEVEIEQETTTTPRDMQCDVAIRRR